MFPEDEEDLQGLEQPELELEEEEVNYEAEAKALGWVPQHKFKGDKGKWVDAKEFVERGEKVMPLLRANNERLRQDLLTRDKQIGTLTQQITEMRKSVSRLEDHFSETNKRAVEAAITDLKTRLKEARENGDVDAETEILGEISDAQEAKRKAEAEDKSSKKNEGEPKVTLDPELIAWQQDNPWFGQDRKKTKEFNRLAEDMRDEDHPLYETTYRLTNRAFLDAVLEEFESQRDDEPEDRKPLRKSSKVEGETPRGRGTSSSKSFADLPADAKRQCLSEADQFVGKDKLYKTADEWKAAYVKLYFG